MSRSNVETIYLDKQNVAHEKMLEQLFTEYAREVSANIDALIVSKLVELPYFHGFLLLVTTNQQVSRFVLNPFQLIDLVKF